MLECKQSQTPQFFQIQGQITPDVHAQRVFERFNMTSLGDYHDLYMKTDVLLLADVFSRVLQKSVPQTV